MNQMTFGVLHMTPEEFQERLGISDDEMYTLTQQFMATPEVIAAAEEKVAAHKGVAMAAEERYRALLRAGMEVVGAVRDHYGLWKTRYDLRYYPGTDPIVIAARSLARLWQ